MVIFLFCPLIPIHQAIDTLDNLQQFAQNVKTQVVLEVVSEASLKKNGLIWPIPRNPAADTLKHKTLPIYSNQMARSKRSLFYTVALSKGCGIGRNAKFLRPLQCKKAPDSKIKGFRVV
jgi:hypothetical protein